MYYLLPRTDNDGHHLTVTMEIYNALKHILITNVKHVNSLLRLASSVKQVFTWEFKQASLFCGLIYVSRLDCLEHLMNILI